MATHCFSLAANDRAHAIEFVHNPLTDKASLRIDGEPVPTRLVRKAFGSVFRYRFSFADAWHEIRVTPSSTQAFDVVLARADEPVTSHAISFWKIASTCGLTGAAGGLGMYLGGFTPLTPSLVVGGGTAVVATALLWLVYGRAR